jgi:hypothetical protein
MNSGLLRIKLFGYRRRILLLSARTSCSKLDQKMIGQRRTYWIQCLDIL